jgi:acyl carrier protein
MAETPDNARIQLRKWVLAEGVKNGGEEPADADDLMQEGFLDSLGLMGLIAYVEELRDKPLSDEEMRMENFTTINRIVKVFFEPQKNHTGPGFGRR